MVKFYMVVGYILSSINLSFVLDVFKSVLVNSAVFRNLFL